MMFGDFVAVVEVGNSTSNFENFEEVVSNFNYVLEILKQAKIRKIYNKKSENICISKG